MILFLSTSSPPKFFEGIIHSFLFRGNSMPRHSFMLTCEMTSWVRVLCYFAKKSSIPDEKWVVGRRLEAVEKFVTMINDKPGAILKHVNFSSVVWSNQVIVLSQHHEIAVKSWNSQCYSNTQKYRQLEVQRFLRRFLRPSISVRRTHTRSFKLSYIHCRSKC